MPKVASKKIDPVRFETKNSLPSGTFHRELKPAILDTVKPKYQVGKNPDILMDKAGNIAYQGANGKGFQDIELNMIDVLKRRGI